MHNSVTLAVDSPYGDKFAPLEDVKQPYDMFWVYFVFAVVIGALLYHFIRRYMERHVAPLDFWSHLKEVSSERHLTAGQEKILKAALRKIDVSTYETAISSEVYYSHYLAPAIAEISSNAMSEQIRLKLFSSETKVVENAAGSHLAGAIKPHTTLRLHFSGFPGQFAATVIQCDEESILVTFATRRIRDLNLNKFDMVEVVFEFENSLVSFRSEIVEIQSGDAYACRISRPARMAQLHQRTGVRTRMDCPVEFCHVSASEISGTRIDMQDLDEKLRDSQRGILREIGLGGCSIKLQTPQDFLRGDLVRFSVKAEVAGEAIELLANVVGVSSKRFERILHLQFIGLDEETSNEIALLMARTELSDDKPVGTDGADNT